MGAPLRRLLANLVAGVVILACATAAAVVGWRMGRPHTHVAPGPAPAAAVFGGAVRAMQVASSYAFAGHVTIGIEVLNVTGGFSAPDRLDETLQLVGGPPVARVSAGAATYQRGSSGWHPVTAAAVSSDPRVVFRALATAEGVTRQGATYAFRLSGPAASALVPPGTPSPSVTGTATIDNGRVDELTYRSPAGAGTTASFSYTAIGTAPAVSVPASIAP